MSCATIVFDGLCALLLVFAGLRLHLASSGALAMPDPAEGEAGQSASRAEALAPDTDPSHTPFFWREVLLPFCTAYLFAWHGNGAGEGFVLWIGLLAPAALFLVLARVAAPNLLEKVARLDDRAFLGLFGLAVLLFLLV